MDEYGTMWIEYNVERLFSSGGHCTEPIKFLILALCEEDHIAYGGSAGADEHDLNGLICGFEMISKDGKEPESDSSGSSSSRRRLIEKADRYSDDVWGVKSSGVYGIRINQRIEWEMRFRLCLKDVFMNRISDRVQFRRGQTKFMCTDQWVLGLPCLDRTRFVHGAYGPAVNGPDWEWMNKKGFEEYELGQPGMAFYDIVRLFFLVLMNIVGIFAIVTMCAYLVGRRLGKKEGKMPSYGQVKESVDSDGDDGIASDAELEERHIKNQ